MTVLDQKTADAVTEMKRLLATGMDLDAVLAMAFLNGHSAGHLAGYDIGIVSAGPTDYRHTPDTQAIIDDIRHLVEAFGQPVNEQVFSAWVPNTNLLSFHIVADSLNERALRPHLSGSATLYHSLLSGSGADEWTIELVVSTYWKRKP